MKKTLLILCLGSFAHLTYAQDQSTRQAVQNSHHQVLGHITGGVVTDANNNFAGDFKATNGQVAISDKNHQVIGYLVSGNQVQDANHKMLGRFSSDGKGTNTITVSNADGKPVGYINFEKGTVMDNNHTLIGYENTEVMWAAPYFFFFKF